MLSKVNNDVDSNIDVNNNVNNYVNNIRIFFENQFFLTQNGNNGDNILFLKQNYLWTKNFQPKYFLTKFLWNLKTKMQIQQCLTHNPNQIWNRGKLK